MPEFDARLAALLRAALDLPETGREDFIMRECAGDIPLAARLRHLLELDVAKALPLDAPVDALAGALLSEPDDAAIEAGTVIGPYRLARELGSGGMGAVWLAERSDGEFEQRVALKLIRLGMDSSWILRQFRIERDVLARLRHPNIAALIDGGLDARGRPWFAMELVDGVSLGEWVSRRHPDLRTRLKLFVKLCRAVAHAHQHLVVHRDLKPSNVLVQADDEPRLLDFGIAKLVAQEDGERTVTIHRFLTSDFAAPEQLRNEPVGTSTDVYALGLILFELLTGLRYRSVRSVDSDITLRPSDALAAATHLESAPAHVSRTDLRGDLDAIVMHALAGEPERRYPGAQQLADDVQRHLDGKPIEARPDSFGYRAAKFMRRNRLAVSTISMALLALLAGFGVSLWQTRRAEQEAHRATVIKEYLIGLFDAGRTNQAGAAALERPIVAMLDDNAGKLAGELDSEPTLRDEIYGILVEIFDANAQETRAQALAAERVRQAASAFGPDDPRVVPALLMQAGVALNHSHTDQAPALLDRARAILDAAGDASSLDRALWWQYQGYYLMQSDTDPVTALRDLARACDLLRQRYPDSDELLVALTQFAQAQLVGDRTGGALAVIDELHARAIRKHGADHLYVTQADFLKARYWMQRGSPQRAVDLLRATRQRLEKFGGEGHNDVVVASYYEVSALLDMQRVEDAEAAWGVADQRRLRHHADDAVLASAFQGLRNRIDDLEQAGGKPSP
jgi:serine/threonine-protein kinase